MISLRDISVKVRVQDVFVIGERPVLMKTETLILRKQRKIRISKVYKNYQIICATRYPPPGLEHRGRSGTP